MEIEQPLVGEGPAGLLGAVALAILLGTATDHRQARTVRSTSEVRAYCADSRSLGTLPAILPSGGDPQDLTRQFGAVRALMAEVAGEAPRDVKDDLELFVRTYTRMLDAAVMVDYDLTRVPRETVDALDSPVVREALQRVAAFDRSNCGSAASDR